MSESIPGQTHIPTTSFLHLEATSMFWLNMREVSRYPSIFLPLKISLSLAIMQTAKRQAHAQKEIILKGVMTTKLFNEVKCLEICY